LYCAAQKVDVKTCEDLGNTLVRQNLQSYFDKTGRFPSPGSPEEYAGFFQSTYPDASDRRRYIDAMIRGGKSSYGHYVLASLMKLDKVRMVWTTNFDRLVEDAAVSAMKTTSNLTVATLDSNDVALRAMNEGSWPLFGKLHGDFQSVLLKNTSEELQHQDAKLRSALVESCKRFGLAVIGYSGRDDSIMAALEEAMVDGNSFPSGLFWFTRSGSSVYQRVTQLVERASNLGIGAHIIEVETFDELMGDAIKQFTDVPADISSALGKVQSRVSNVPLLEVETGTKIIRLNALPVILWPEICRKIECQIGGSKALREHLEASTANLVAARSSAGVLAFGSDTEVRRVFGNFQIASLGLHSIEAFRLKRDTHEMNLLRQALVTGLAKGRPLFVEKHRSTFSLRVDQNRADDQTLISLRTAVSQVAGVIPSSSIAWAEAVRIRLEYKLDRLWLMLDPYIWFAKCATDDQLYIAGDFVRERMARRYNKQFNSTFSAWIRTLLGDDDECTIEAFSEQPGISASFVIGKRSGYTRSAL
jgi:hypothetical protein